MNHSMSAEALTEVGSDLECRMARAVSQVARRASRAGERQQDGRIQLITRTAALAKALQYDSTASLRSRGGSSDPLTSHRKPKGFGEQSRRSKVAPDVIVSNMTAS